MDKYAAFLYEYKINTVRPMGISVVTSDPLPYRTRQDAVFPPGVS
jgi:hypothetical protein